MSKRLKKGQEVFIIAGAEKGKQGEILGFNTKKNRVYVKGLAMQKKHLPKSEQNPQGAIVEKEGSIHYSNLMAVETYNKRKSSVNAGK